MLEDYEELMIRERQRWDAIHEWLPCLFRCALTAMALEVQRQRTLQFMMDSLVAHEEIF